MPTPEMLAVRGVNVRIGNLSSHEVFRIESLETRLVLRFQERAAGADAFGLGLDGVLGFHDHGVISRPLTAGIVWNPAADFGRRLAAEAGREPAGLVELRLDFEDAAGLVVRFNAVAESVCLIGAEDSFAS